MNSRDCYDFRQEGVQRRLLLLDVGGTFIKCSDSREIPVDSQADAQAIREAFRKATEPARLGLVDGIGIAMPGPFNYSTGEFMMKHKFQSVYGMLFRDVACVPAEVELKFTHDVNGMLSGELSFGNARPYRNVALVTLGTGLGFSVCIGGTILKNANGSPLESLYNRPYRESILEDYISKRAITNLYRLLSQSDFEGSVKEIAHRAGAGDKAAKQTFRETALILGQQLVPILKEKQIECLLLGGQISRSYSLMESVLADCLKEISSLRHIGPISDFDNATFNGLKSLFIE